jgi:hypothetical protein
MVQRRIELGDIARDTISGFEGVVVAETNWLHSCRRLTLQPKKLHDGNPVDNRTFDEPQCELVKARKAPLGLRNTGGPAPNPTQHRGPVR